MPRPLNLSRRQALAREAFALLRQNPHGLTMTELASRLGLKRPTLYYYFQDTAAVIDAAMADLLTRQQQHLVGQLVGRHHPVDLLDAWVEAVRTFYAESPSDLHLFALILAHADAPGSLASRLAQHRRPVHELAVRTLRDGLTRGLVETCDPEAVVALVAATIDGALLGWHAARLPPEPTFDALWVLALAPLRIPRLGGSEALEAVAADAHG